MNRLGLLDESLLYNPWLGLMIRISSSHPLENSSAPQDAINPPFNPRDSRINIISRHGRFSARIGRYKCLRFDIPSACFPDPIFFHFFLFYFFGNQCNEQVAMEMTEQGGIERGGKRNSKRFLFAALAAGKKIQDRYLGWSILNTRIFITIMTDLESLKYCDRTCGYKKLLWMQNFYRFVNNKCGLWCL